MPDGYLISVGVKADFSELKSEQQEAQAIVTATGDEMIATYEGVTVAAAEAAPAIAAAGAASGHSVSEHAAAAAAMKTLEGNFTRNTRAADRFLISSLNLGPALQAAFPVIGAVALGGILLDVGKKIFDFGVEANDLATELGTDWLSGAIAQMDGLGAAVKQADQEIDKLNKDLDRTKDQTRQAQIEHIRLTQGPAAAYNAEASDSKHKEKVVTDGLNIALLEEARLKKETQFGAHPEMTPGAEVQARLAATKGLEVIEKQILDYKAEGAKLSVTTANLELQAQQVKEKPAKGGTKATKEDDDFGTERLMAEMAIKDQKNIEEAIKKTAEEHGKMVMEMVQDDERISNDNDRVTEEITAAWEKGYNEDLRAAEKLEKEKESLAAKDARRQQSEAMAYQKSWDKALNEVGRQASRVQTEMLRGQISFSTAAKRMGSELALDAVQWGEKELAAHFMKNMRKLASTYETNTGMVASDRVAAQASTMTTMEEAIKQAFIHAKLAAVKAFDWGSAWGGPIVGAIAAAAAFTGAMAWAAFEHGGIVGGSIGSAVPIVAHAGERVLTTQQTSTFERMVNGGGGGVTSGGPTNHFGGNTFNGIADTKTFEKMLMKSNRANAASVKKAMRNGHF